jgi:hypothetical protein
MTSDAVEAQVDGPASKEGTGSGDDAAELAKKLQNPVANLISVPIQSNWDFGIGREEAMRYLLNVQPVIPFSLNQDWNLITRTILPFIHMESPVPGGDDTGGISDILQSFFFSPKDPVGGWIAGGGPVFLYPSASDDALGAEKWGAGPTAVLLKQEKGWTYGLLTNHVWSFAGSDSRQDQRHLPPAVPFVHHEDVYHVRAEHGVNLRLGEQPMDGPHQRSGESVAETPKPTGPVYPGCTLLCGEARRRTGVGPAVRGDISVSKVRRRGYIAIPHPFAAARANRFHRSVIGSARYLPRAVRLLAERELASPREAIGRVRELDEPARAAGSGEGLLRRCRPRMARFGVEPRVGVPVGQLFQGLAIVLSSGAGCPPRPCAPSARPRGRRCFARSRPARATTAAATRTHRVMVTSVLAPGAAQPARSPGSAQGLNRMGSEHRYFKRTFSSIGRVLLGS